VTLDVRKYSPNFGKYSVLELNEENKKQLFIHQGLAFSYPAIGINWMLN